MRNRQFVFVVYRLTLPSIEKIERFLFLRPKNKLFLEKLCLNTPVQIITILIHILNSLTADAGVRRRKDLAQAFKESPMFDKLVNRLDEAEGFYGNQASTELDLSHFNVDYPTTFYQQVRHATF